ncbi:response regulator [Burkholderiaceae bacterium DAT-1]|nr:response regulator [Burkholderiaceae bacterium DAT-1]
MARHLGEALLEEEDSTGESTYYGSLITALADGLQGKQSANLAPLHAADRWFSVHGPLDAALACKFAQLVNLHALGDFDAAWRYAQDNALPLVNRTHASISALQVLNSAGVSAQEAGDMMEALRLFLAAQAMARTLGNTEREAHIALNLAELYFAVGHIPDAELLLIDSLQLVVGSKESWLAPYIATELVITRVALGNAPGALEVATQFLPDSCLLHLPNDASRVYCLLCKALAHLENGDIALAQALHRRAGALLTSLNRRQLLRLSQFLSARLASISEQNDLAESLYIALLNNRTEGDWTWITLRVLDELSHLLEKRGLLAPALVHQRQYLAEFSRAQTQARDIIDESRRYAASLQQAYEVRRQAELAVEMRSRFLIRLGHQIRTPMNAIVGMAHLTLATQLDARQRGYLQHMQSAANGLLDVVGDLVECANLDAGMLTLKTRSFNLHDWLHELCERYALLASEASIQFHLNIEGDLPTSVLGDPDKLAQALSRLIDNAFAHTSQGSVELGIRGVSSSVRPEVILHFSVKDSGAGFDPSSMPDLFEPFTLSEQSFKHGPGLGLPIARGLARLMEGEVVIDSEPGQGTLSRLTVPLVSTASLDKGRGANQPVPQSHLPDFSGKSFLFVEDNDINIQILEEFMSDTGAAVDFALDGQEAVERVLQRGPEAYDLVLMDIDMPRLSGTAATHAIRRHPAFASLPIIAMTALSSASDKQSFVTIGMNDVLAKPFEPKQLYDTLCKWVSPPERTTSQDSQASQLVSNDYSPELADLPELLVSQGLKRTLGDESLYFDLIERFLAEQAMTGEDILDTVSTHPAEASRKAHTLKSVSSLIGAHRVSRIAEQLEDEINAGMKGSKIDSLVLSLERAMQELSLALSHPQFNGRFDSDHLPAAFETTRLHSSPYPPV